MNQASRKVLEILKDSERIADQVLQNKQEIVQLDKRRQETREAIRDLGKDDERKVWITIGPILVKMEKAKAFELMKKDQQTINVEINKLRSEQKELMSKLRQVECQAPIVGFDLKPLDRKEVNALSSNLPGF
ncbi:uncharacterized protein LOC129574344 [Sitodiplosis mosellana]|uniref:uncharacterized protein LOC129574344 n=1 Tax=Sitodiplosis mosellana TaxID=263140 RepID=UPI002443F69E|nr:uncharacterized protein LOC129574344 [Sitodiplosis mosellana]XP_055312185.1 uncharacterized protein LOC129574344 [Sitodiplosis mosellana]